MAGKFITLEGGEGAGKSTQAKLLACFLETCGVNAIVTREIGGSRTAEDIRALWLEKEEGCWDPITELLLTMAARREHLVKTVWPALEGNSWVVSDRFVDSARVYQGIGLGLGIGKVDAVYAQIAGGFFPDLTLLLDIPAEEGLARMTKRSGPDDRYQRRPKEFHEKLRDGFLDIAKKEPERFRVIDASRDQEKVAADIRVAVSRFFGLAGERP